MYQGGIGEILCCVQTVLSGIWWLSAKYGSEHFVDVVLDIPVPVHKF